MHNAKSTIGDRAYAVLAAGLAWALGAPVAAAAAGSFTILGDVGYEAVDLGAKNNGGGLAVGAAGDYAFTRLPGGPALLGGGGLKYEKLSFSKDGVDTAVTLTTFGLEVGVGFAAASRLNLEAMLGYEFLMSGDYAVKTAAGSDSKTIKNFSRIDHEYRAIFSVYQATSVGFGVSWFAGSFDATDAATDILLQGYALRFLLQHRL